MKGGDGTSRACVALGSLATFVLLASCNRTARPASVGGASDVDSVVVGVSAAPDTSRASQETAPPTLSRIVPASARIERSSVVTMTIEGLRFDRGRNGRNTVEIGPIRLSGVPSDTLGRIIQVVVPERIPADGEAPPRRLLPGDYPVTVSTPAGKSNVIQFRVLP